MAKAWTSMPYAVYGKRKDGSRVQRFVGYIHAVQHEADALKTKHHPPESKAKQHIAINKLTGTDDKHAPQIHQLQQVQTSSHIL